MAGGWGPYGRMPPMSDPENVPEATQPVATALPTFIEHGAAQSMVLVGPDGSTLPLDLDGFRQATSQAPDGAVGATLALPLEWLRDVTVVDLPGLGSVSAARQDGRRVVSVPRHRLALPQRPPQAQRRRRPRLWPIRRATSAISTRRANTRSPRCRTCPTGRRSMAAAIVRSATLSM